ncbi:family 78 glycoside hydrolase catalytic domain [Clostridium diolis]|uniref:family 78 glycoside hydrolase catalytic domain n=1 Tax=Clostridium diolis TaxID=223919 RepID=UPI003AF84939
MTYDVNEIDLKHNKLKAISRLSIKVKQKLKPAKVIINYSGETILDFGQVIVGWVEFKTNAPKNSQIRLQYGEIIMDDNLTKSNLIVSDNEFKYIANGKTAVVRSYFTCFRFRFVKVIGWEGEIDTDDFNACILI